jgi:hypothetical protein
MHVKDALEKWLKDNPGGERDALLEVATAMAFLDSPLKEDKAYQWLWEVIHSLTSHFIEPPIENFPVFLKEPLLEDLKGNAPEEVFDTLKGLFFETAREVFKGRELAFESFEKEMEAKVARYFGR